MFLRKSVFIVDMGTVFAQNIVTVQTTADRVRIAPAADRSQRGRTVRATIRRVRLRRRARRHVGPYCTKDIIVGGTPVRSPDRTQHVREQHVVRDADAVPIQRRIVAESVHIVDTEGRTKWRLDFTIGRRTNSKLPLRHRNGTRANLARCVPAGQCVEEIREENVIIRVEVHVSVVVGLGRAAGRRGYLH